MGILLSVPAGAQYDPVSLDSSSLTRQGDISEVIIFSQSSECFCVFLLVIIPAETEVLVLHDSGSGHWAHHMRLQSDSLLSTLCLYLRY